MRPTITDATAAELRAASPEDRVQIAREVADMTAAMLQAIELGEIDATPAERGRLEGIELSMRLIGEPWP